MIRSLLNPVLLTLVSCAAAFAQNGSIEGRVTNEAGEPLKGAYVRLQSSQAPFTGYYTETDAEGRFLLDDIRRQRYGFQVSRSGYRGSSSLYSVDPGQRLTGIAVKLKQAILITGRVVDEYGDPMPFARVELRTEDLRPGGAANARADGSFVFGNNAPSGRYYLSAEQSNIGTSASFRDQSGPQLGYVVTYFPGTADPSKATLVSVKAGEEVRNLEIRMTKGRTFHIGGTLVNGDTGMPLSNVAVALRSLSVQNLGQIQRTASDGSFEFPRLVPGDYVVYDDPANPSKPQLVGRRKVTIANANVDGLVLKVAPGLEIPGKFTLDGGGDTSMVRLDLRTDDPLQPLVYFQVTRKEEGVFLVHNLEPDTYRTGASNLPEGVYVKSVRFGGKDVTNANVDLTQDIAGKALEIVLSPHAAKITGTLPDWNGTPFEEMLVTLHGPGEFSVTRGTGETGMFEFDNLAPGEYRIGASANTAPPKDDFDAQAATLTLTEDARVTVTPPLIVSK